MMQQSRKTLQSYLIDLQAQGRLSFARSDAIVALGLTKGAFLKAAARLERRKMLLNPRQGFYIVVPRQYISWEAPPPAWYVDALMRQRAGPTTSGCWRPPSCMTLRIRP